MNILQAFNGHELLTKALRLCRTLQSCFEGSEALIVGGAPRDLLLGREIHDVDIATNIGIEDLRVKFQTAEIGQSKDFGIILVLFEDQRFEVAHFREEVGSKDNRHPEVVRQVNTFKNDTARRDFTINSLGIDVNGEIIDFQGGVRDIEKKVLRAIGNPEDRFQEDALRIFRAARFASRFGFSIEVETASAMIECRHLTKSLSAERVHEELFKAASSGKVLADFVELLDLSGQLEIHLPEIWKMKGMPHTIETHPEGDVFCHTLAALRNGNSSDALVNVAILFHDIGKPVTLTLTEEMKPQYKSHESEGVEVFKGVAERLKFSNEESEAIQFAIKYHMIAHSLLEMKKSKLVQLCQSPYFSLLREVALADDKARGQLFDSELFNQRFEKAEEIFRLFGERQEFEGRMKRLIDGKMILDLASALGMNLPGTKVGEIKETVREVILEREFQVSEEEVKELILNEISR